MAMLLDRTRSEERYRSRRPRTSRRVRAARSHRFLRQEDDVLAEFLEAIDGKINFPRMPGIGAKESDEKL
jgi:hypothetical protein